MSRVVLDQINIVSGDPDASVAFYRRLGVDIPEDAVWRTKSGPHHISAIRSAEPQALDFDIDSTAFAQRWNVGWAGRGDLAGRVVVGFGVAARADVDAIYAEMTAAGHRGLQPPIDAFWGARYAIIEDPDGIAVGLMSPIDARQENATAEGLRQRQTVLRQRQPRVPGERSEDPGPSLFVKKSWVRSSLALCARSSGHESECAAACRKQAPPKQAKRSVRSQRPFRRCGRTRRRTSGRSRPDS